MQIFTTFDFGQLKIQKNCDLFPCGKTSRSYRIQYTINYFLEIFSACDTASWPSLAGKAVIGVLVR